VALEGTIKDFGLPDIFQLIGLQRKTGLLQLNNGQETVTIAFENGMVVSAESSLKRLEDRLGTVLVKQGKLTRDQLEEALQTQRATLQRLGHVVVGLNYVTPADLRDALQVQVSQIVYKVFRWREGEYHFAPAEQVDYDRENFTPLSADFILMEGIRMVDEWPIIEKKIPSLDIVFRTLVDPGLIEVAAPEAEAGDAKRGGAATRIRLTPDEERVLRRVDGTRSVQGIIDATGLGEFDVCRTLFDLLNRSIIAPVGRAEAQEARGGEDGEELVAARWPGWALLAAVLVLALLSVTWRLRDPYGVTGLAPSLTKASLATLESLDAARLRRVDRAVMAYRLLTGNLPESLSEAARAGLLDGGDLKDPWARPYHYSFTDGGYELSADPTAPGREALTIVRRVPPDRTTPERR
jgi:hypothetical protein